MQSTWSVQCSLGFLALFRFNIWCCTLLVYIPGLIISKKHVHVCTTVCQKIAKIILFIWVTGMVQWWEHSPSTHVAWVRFPELTPWVGWVCCWFSSLPRGFLSRSGLEKNLNSSLPFGKVALKFCLPWASLRLLFLQFSWQMTCLGPCPLGKWEWKVTCPTGKSTCPGQPDGTFFEPCRQAFSQKLKVGRPRSMTCFL